MKRLVSAAALCFGFIAFGSDATPLLPVGDDSSAAIQAAIDNAAANQGTVTLGEGLFTIKSQLMVTGGVTVVGQGWDKTVLKYDGTANTSASRVATVRDGSTLSRVAVTGASVKAQNGAGAVSVSDGTISCCCITNNANSQGTGGGITANGSGYVKILRSIVANNSAATVFDGVGGGIGVRGENGLRVEIDACLVSGNKTGGSKDRHGAGVGVSHKNKVTTILRNTTIANNVLTGAESLGGGLYSAQADTTLINCLLSGNTVQTTATCFGDANAAFSTGGVEIQVAAKSANNVFDSAGNAGFVSANDYHLSSTSPALRQGVACADLTTDLDGNAYAATRSVGCYEFTGANPNPMMLPPTLGSVNVVPFEKSVSFSGVLTGLGTDATSCDVLLSIGGAAATTIVTDATKTFDHTVFGLSANTTYAYTLSVVNNATPAQTQTRSGSFTTLGAESPATLADYTNYRKYSGAPQAVLLSYYDGPDTRGFSWETADCVTSGKVWIRKGDYTSENDIVGKSDTTEIAAASVVHAGKCTTYKVFTGKLSAGLWSYCLGTEGKTFCGQFTVRAEEGGFTAVNYNDIQTKEPAKLFRWGNVATATCNALPSGFDCILSGGDFIDGSVVGLSDCDDYIQWGVIADTGRSKLGDAPWIMACGNHESEACSRGYDIFKELACEKFDYTPDAKHIGCHAFEQGGAIVATLPYYDNGSALPTAVTNWLVRTLTNATNASWRIVMLHSGPYTTGDHGPSAGFLSQMTPLFARLKVDLVLQAHDHTYSRTVPYLWSGVGYTTTWGDPDVVSVNPATTNVEGAASVPYYLDPEGTFYVSVGCSGHRLGENASYASGKDVFSFSNRTHRTQIDSVKLDSPYAAAGSLGSKDLTMPMFAVLKINGGLLTYDWYVAEEDGSATPFDTLRICKSGVAPVKPEPGPALPDYDTYRDSSGLPQAVTLSYYDGPDTRGFAWQTASSVTAGKVWLRKGSYASAAEIVGQGDTIEIAADVSTHSSCTTYKAVATALSVGDWSYCLGSEGRTVCGKFTVRDAAGSVTVVNVNDVETKYADQIVRWQDTVAAVSATTSDPDFLLSGGDLYHGDIKYSTSDATLVTNANKYVEWGMVIDLARSKLGDTPWIMAAGNHDSALASKLVCENYAYTEADHYGCHVFEQGGVAFLTLPFYANESVVPAGVTNWLVSALTAASNATWRVVALHAGPYTTGSHVAVKAFLQQLSPIFAQHKVDLVMQGHDHTYSRTLPYRWSGKGFTQSFTDSANVNLAPATTNVQSLAGVPCYLNPEGTVYVAAGTAGHDVGTRTAYAGRGTSSSYTNHTFKIVTDTVKLSSKYAEAGADGSKDVGKPTFAVLKVDGGLLTYDWYVAETDGTATHFDTLRICKSGVAPVKPEPGPTPTPVPGEGSLAPYKWAVIGDSISDPVHPTKDTAVVKYYHYLSRDTGIRVVYTNAVGGTGYKAGLDSGKAFCQRLEANPIPADVDVVTIFGSVNDGGSATSAEAAGQPTDDLATTNTLSAYVNRALDLVQQQAPNAKIILSGGIFYVNAHPDRHIRVNETVRAIAARRGIEFHDWLTANPEDPLDFHQIAADPLAENSFASRYTIDWMYEKYGHPNDLYNEQWLAPHFGEVLTIALKASLGEVTTVPESNACALASSVISLGTTDATACDVYLAWGTDAANLGPAVKIRSGLALGDPVAYTMENLLPGTTYYYEISATNNAALPAGHAKTGSFITKKLTKPVGALGDFAKKIVFTVGYDGVESLGGLAVPVKLAAESPSGFRYSDCDVDGGDIRFADASGNAIPFEFDTWDPAGESVIWVKAPAVTNGTVFTMYYSGTPAAANDPSAVWSGYTGVWHFGEIEEDATPYSQGRYANSTATTEIDGHLSTNSIAGESGYVGKSFRVNDSTDWNVGNFNEGGVWINDAGANSPLDADGVFTISGWFKHNTWHYNYDSLIYKRVKSDDGDNGGAFAVLLARNNNENIVQAYSVKGSRVRNTENLGPNLKGEWVYITLVYNNTTCTIYENGVQNATGTIAKAADNDLPLVFGNNANIANGLSGGTAWNGWIDEVRFTKSAKSAAWVAAEYAAMANASFLSMSAAIDVGDEPGPTPPGPTPPGPTPPGPTPEPVPGTIEPSGDATGATDYAAIQAAIDAAAPTNGTVTLAAGLFQIKTELMVTGGVTLVGQGWTNSVIKQVTPSAANVTHRVLTVKDGATVRGLALTGGNGDANGTVGAGVYLDGTATLSWCCVTNNVNKRYRAGGVYVSGKGKVVIDHTVIADNVAASAFDLGGSGGGLMVRLDQGGEFVMDACLVTGNVCGHAGTTAHGGGISLFKNAGTVTIRNTTVAHNSVSGSGVGGGLYVGGGKATLVNCLFVDNTSEATATYGDANFASGTSALTPATTTCLNLLAPTTKVFVGGGDYRLAALSPAIGAGTAYTGIGTDLDDKTFAATPSVGCYEYVGGKPSVEDWDHPAVEITATTTAGEAWPSLANSTLANANAGKLKVWAQGVGAVAFNASATILTEAFLLNCANTQAAVDAAKAAFAFSSFDPDALPEASDFDAKGYNGVVTIEGRASLDSGAWHAKASGDRFFRARLSL